MASTGTDPDARNQIHITLPPYLSGRALTLPAVCFCLGSLIGFVRGGRAAGVRFLAENAHRTPRTRRGWYLYQKTKNYRVLWGGLRGAGGTGARLAACGVGWVGTSEGLRYVGLGDVSEVGAGVGTAGTLAAVYRLPRAATVRMMTIGVLFGGTVQVLGWTADRLAKERDRRATEGAGAEGAVEAEGDVRPIRG